MKKLFTAFLFLSVFFAALAGEKPRVYLQTDLVSAYLWRGQRNAGVSLQPVAGIKWQGLHFYAWGNVQLCPPSGEPVKHEIDFFLKYTIRLSLIHI